MKTFKQNVKVQGQKGFTLIELMITVAIVAILAAVALPAYKTYTVRAQVTEGLIAASSAKQDIAEGFISNGAAGAAAAAGSIGANGNGQSKFIAAMSAEDGTGPGIMGEITVTFGNEAAPEIGTVGSDTLILSPRATVDTTANAAAYLLLSAANAGGGVDWGCASDAQTVAPARTINGSAFGAITAGTVPSQYVPAECK